MLNINSHGIFEAKGFFDSFPTPLRVTKSYELEIYEPCDCIQMVNGEKYIHNENAVFLFRPGTERCSMGPFSCIFLHFNTDDEDCAAYLAQIPTCIPIDANGNFKAICLQIADCEADTPAGRLRQSCLLLSLLLKLGEQSAKKPFPVSQPHKYAKNLMDAKKYIDGHFSEKITLEKLTEITFLSKNFFRTLFFDYFGISPSEYLTNVRIVRAVTLFKSTVLPFSEIALLCGFGSQSYMNAVIKHRTGRTPLEFRRDDNSEAHQIE